MKIESPIKRRVSRQIFVGNVPVGGDAPISVQSMTNTDTCDVSSTVAQVLAIADAGADMVRISVPSMEAAEAFRRIREQVTVPLIADIHFDHKIALKVIEYGVDQSHLVARKLRQWQARNLAWLLQNDSFRSLLSPRIIKQRHLPLLAVKRLEDFVRSLRLIPVNVVRVMRLLIETVSGVSVEDRAAERGTVH